MVSSNYFNLITVIYLNTVIWFQVFPSNTNNYMVSSNYFNLITVIYLNTVIWFQVFPSNTNNYMVSSNYFNLITVIYLNTVIWFQVFPSNTNNYMVSSNYFDLIILNKSWRHHPTRHQLYGHLSPITKTIQVRRTSHTGHCWGSKDECISDALLWTPTYGRAKVGRPARTYIQQLCEDTGCIIVIYLNTVIWFQVFPSNTNNYMVSSNYFNLITVIYLNMVSSK